MNQRDRDHARLTADDQKGSRTDTEITRQIRRAVVADKGLSMYAHNVKIITKGGNVTLRGPVRSEQEKQTVEAKAAEIAADRAGKDDKEDKEDKDEHKIMRNIRARPRRSTDVQLRMGGFYGW